MARLPGQRSAPRSVMPQPPRDIPRGKVIKMNEGSFAAFDALGRYVGKFPTHGTAEAAATRGAR